MLERGEKRIARHGVGASVGGEETERLQPSQGFRA